MSGGNVPLRADGLWAITSYFNPMSYHRRRQNYEHFRSALGVPLLVVELSNSEHYELQADDADIVVRTASRSVLWQKERLLNVALEHLPAHVEHVAWLDCDVIFERQDWHVAAASGLRKRPLIQLFASRSDLPREPPHPGPRSTEEMWTIDSVAKHVSMASRSAHGSASGDARSILNGAFGLAWAARRELLDKHGFYDAMVMGSGDVAMVCAAFGIIAAAAGAIRLNEAQYRHYESWAAAFHRDVAGDVGYLEGRVFHLWHGERLHRHYARRHVEFGGMSFDPRIDLRVNETGAFEWADERDDLNRFAVEYFRSRLEDGT
jgi:hypothetical protein